MIKTANILKTTAFVTLLSASSLLMAGQHDGASAEGKPHGYKQGGHHQFHHAGPGMGGERWLARMGDKLELSDDQKAKIKDISDKSGEKRTALKEASNKAREAEMKAIHGRENEKTLRKLARDSADARVDLMVHGFEVEKRINEVLTQEQRDKLDAIKAERKAKMKEHKTERMEKYRERSGKDSNQD